MKSNGVYLIRYKSSQQNFDVFGIDLKNFKVKTFESTRKTNESKKEIEIPKSVKKELIKRDAALLGPMLCEACVGS